MWKHRKSPRKKGRAGWEEVFEDLKILPTVLFTVKGKGHSGATASTLWLPVFRTSQIFSCASSAQLHASSLHAGLLHFHSTTQMWQLPRIEQRINAQAVYCGSWYFLLISSLKLLLEQRSLLTFYNQPITCWWPISLSTAIPLQASLNCPHIFQIERRNIFPPMSFQSASSTS